MTRDEKIEVKRYLNRAYKLDLIIESKRRQLDNLRSRAMSLNNEIRESVQSSMSSCLEDNVINILDYERVIHKDIERLIDIKMDISNLIDSLEDNNIKILLNLRYLEFKEWRDIAQIMGYEIDNIYKVHNKALLEVKKQKNQKKYKLYS